MNNRFGQGIKSNWALCPNVYELIGWAEFCTSDNMGCYTWIDKRDFIAKLLAIGVMTLNDFSVATSGLCFDNQLVNDYFLSLLRLCELEISHIIRGAFLAIKCGSLVSRIAQGFTQ